MRLPLNGWRKVAVSAWRSPNDPTTYGLLDIDATACLAYMDALRQVTGVRITLLSVVIKAIGHALSLEPGARARIRFGGLVERTSLDVFAQVDRGGGEDLSGIKLTGVPERGVADIAREIETRVAAVRSSESAEELRRSVKMTDGIPRWLLPLSLKIQDWLSNDLQIALPFLGIFANPFGAAMVTNIGSLGLDLALAPIPPICRCLLVCAVGRVRERPWVVDGQVVVRPVVSFGISFDHRYLDGAHAARMADNFQAAMNDPLATFGLPALTPEDAKR